MSLRGHHSGAAFPFDADAARTFEAACRRFEAWLPRSLRPEGGTATPLPQLGLQMGASAAPDVLAEVLHALARIVLQFAADYPENIFCDLDALCTALLEAPHPAARVELTESVLALSAQFGGRSPLRFRYLHDFVYGLDWSRWARKAPALRGGTCPYSASFLDYLATRGRELVQLVATNDAKYGRLPAEAFRNPFGFSREPEDEARLLLHLARQGMLPLEAWEVSARPRMTPFAELREEAAEALGLAPRRPT